MGTFTRPVPNTGLRGGNDGCKGSYKWERLHVEARQQDDLIWILISRLPSEGRSVSEIGERWRN